MGNRTALGTIVANHVSDALKYGEGVPVQISAPTDEAGCSALFRFIDATPDSEESECSRIFEQYSCADRPDSTVAEFGPGLWSAHGCALLHGSSISFDATTRPGTALLVTLPPRRDAARASRSVR